MAEIPQPFVLSASRTANLLLDYAELTKARITALIVVTAWSGYFFGAHKSGASALSVGLLHALLGVGLVSSGTAALNEVLELSVDARMRRTAQRPLPAGRMTRAHATAVGMMLTLGGSLYLALAANPLTGWLALLTALVYLAAYTPLKRVSPICTFVGAFPGAMPALLGWTAARGRVEMEAVILFGIMFVWQFPHFFSIAWLYREDYARGEIRMLPVVEPDGRSTVMANSGVLGRAHSGEHSAGCNRNDGTRLSGRGASHGRGTLPRFIGNGVSAITGDVGRIQNTGPTAAARDDCLPADIVCADDGQLGHLGRVPVEFETQREAHQLPNERH